MHACKRACMRAPRTCWQHIHSHQVCLQAEAQGRRSLTRQRPPLLARGAGQGSLAGGRAAKQLVGACSTWQALQALQHGVLVPPRHHGQLVATAHPVVVCWILSEPQVGVVHGGGAARLNVENLLA